MSALADLFPREVSCHRAMRLEVSADAAWAVVGDIGSTVPGGGMIERVDVDGEGRGAIRVFHVPGGLRIVERIEEYDPHARRYVYRILDGGPLDCIDYLGRAQVVQAGADGCIVSWAAMANPLAGGAEGLKAMLQANIEGALAAIAAHLRAAAQ